MAMHIVCMDFDIYDGWICLVRVDVEDTKPALSPLLVPLKYA